MKIVDLGINGEGVGRENGKVYFVKNALPGEDVEIQTLKETKDFVIGKSQRIENISKDRVKPECPYFFVCGGCQLQHMKYEKQLEFKRDLVKNTLKKVGDIDFDVEETFASNKIYNYRNKSVFQAFCENGRACFGMFKEKTNDGVKTRECKIANEISNKVLKITQDFFYNEIYDSNLKQLVVRVKNDVPLITLVVKHKHVKKLFWYTEELKKNFNEFSLNLHISPDFKKGTEENINIYGEEVLKFQDFGIEQTISSGSFLQVNDDVKQALYNSVLEQIQENEIVIDAYCGAGLLSALLSKKAKYVYGIESFEEAVRSGQKLISDNHINNVSFICGKCEKEIPNILPNIEEDFTIVLDPPRKGCDIKVLNSILDVKPSKIIYVSCNPISLSKDLKVLVDGGYVLSKVKPFDMFPQTCDVETLAILTKK